MLNIGKLQAISPDGRQELVGEIQTLDVDLKIRLLLNNEQAGANAPTYHVFARGRSGSEVQIGAAWEKTIRSQKRFGEHFLSLTLDDPSFAAPLNVAAFKSPDDETVFDVSWRRRQDRQSESEVSN
jgi:uncharacterized protein (DUF736 family)